MEINSLRLEPEKVPRIWLLADELDRAAQYLGVLLGRRSAALLCLANTGCARSVGRRRDRR